MCVARCYLYATGNRSFGYFGGGSDSFGGKFTLDRVDYSNDTATALVRGSLSRVGKQGGAVSSRENANPLKGPGNLEVPVAFGNFSVLALFLPELILVTLLVGIYQRLPTYINSRPY